MISKKEPEMKRFLKDAALVLLPTAAIVGAYAALDNWSRTPPAAVPPPVRRSDVKLLPRNYITFNGHEINERNYMKVLLLDLNGDGIRLYGPEKNRSLMSFLFDFNNDDFSEQAFLPGSDDAFLFYGREDLCKSKSRELDGGKILGSGLSGYDGGDIFEELRRLNNGRETITPQDELYARLTFWKPGAAMNFRESFQDCGRGTPFSEKYFSTPEKERIASISLAAEPAQQVDGHGNVLGRYADVVFADGRHTRLREVWLNTNNMLGTYKMLPVSEDIKKLPDIQGMGVVFSLHQAMERDESRKLRDLVVKFTETDDFLEQLGLINDIVYLWAGVADADPASRVSEDGVNYIGDARKLLVLEKLMGQKFRGTHTGSEETNAPHFQSAPYVLDAYDNFYGHVWQTLLAESGELQSWLESIQIIWNSEKKEWSSDVSAFSEKAKAYYEKNGLGKTKVMMYLLSKKLDFFTPEKDFYGNVGQSVRNNLNELGEIVPDIRFADAEKLILKGAGKIDTLTGTSGDDLIAGLGYNDDLHGGLGNDVYFYRLNDGMDAITETGGVDTIAFSGDIRPQDLEYSVRNLGLSVGIKQTPGQGIVIRNYALSPENRVERLLFAGGESVNLEAVYEEMLSKDWKLRLKTRFRAIITKLGL